MSDPMAEDDKVESEVLVRGERCTVTAVKDRTSWMASGVFRGKQVEVRRASSSAQAVEWWRTKAGMRQPDE
jgi:hypothetical protein